MDGSGAKESSASAAVDDSVDASWPAGRHGLKLLAGMRAERSVVTASTGQDQRLTDLDLLLSDGRVLGIHSCVVRVFSDFFRTMLSVDMRERCERRVDLSHLEARHVAYCIDLLYGTAGPLDKDSVLELAFVANFLSLPPVAEHCQAFLLSRFTADELDAAYSTFEDLHWDGFRDRIDREVRLESWEDANRLFKFSLDRLIRVLARPDLSVSAEDRVLDVCSRWLDDRQGAAAADVAAGDKARLLGCVRQLYLSPDCLTKFRTLAAACGFSGALPAQPPLSSVFRRLELASASAAPRLPRCATDRLLFISGPDILQGGCLSMFFLDPLQPQAEHNQHNQQHAEQLDAPEFKNRTVELQCCVGGGGCALFMHETVMNVMYSFVSMPAPASLYAIDLAGVLPVRRYPGVPESLVGFRMVCLGHRLYAFGGRDCRMDIKDLVFVFDHRAEAWNHEWHLPGETDSQVPVFLPQPMCEHAILPIPESAFAGSDGGSNAGGSGRDGDGSFDADHRYVLLSGGRTNADNNGDPRPALGCLYRYDTVRREFAQLSGMNRSRFGHSMHRLAGRVYVFGGTPDSSERQFSFAEYYDPVQDQWTVVVALEGLGPSRPLTAVLSGRLFYLGRPHGREIRRDGLWEFQPASAAAAAAAADEFGHLRDLPKPVREATRRETHCVALAVRVSQAGLRSLRLLLREHGAAGGSGAAGQGD